MRVIRDLDDPAITTPTVLTFGVFDGLHLGHQLIMERLVSRARATGLAPTAVTFEPHPRAVLHPQTAPLSLQTLEQKVEGMSRLGVEQIIVLSFTREVSLIPAETFLRDIVFGRLDAREVYLGQGFAFGHNREGRFEMLEQVADHLGRVAGEIPEVLIRGRRVSSTAIRRLLGTGHVNLARRMLSRPYGIDSRVIEGRRIGRDQLTFATANLRPHNCVIPLDGVYVTLSHVEGQWRRSLTNVGHRPTFGNDPELTVETHLIDFDHDIYGERLRVRFLHRLRAEVKFESPEDLRLQIGRDYRRALRYFAHPAVRRNLDFV